MLNANSLQDQIKYIRSLPDLTDAEKSKKISETMRTWTTKKASQVKEKEEAKEKAGPQCSHYLRNCDIQCPDCRKFYPCRICHDEAEAHPLRRHDITHVRCRSCKTIQSASNQCVMCGIKFGRYYCDICHLWELSNSPIYHCEKCGICRKGKREDYIHCDFCGMCYSKNVFKNHKCLQNCTKTNCPVCNEFMFDTRQEIMILKCGHSMHAKCLKDYSKHDYRCPLCKKSLVDMSEQWKNLDAMRCMEILPEDFKKKRLVISCNDCEKRSDIKFSFEFRKCRHCKGYNTSEIETYETTEDVVSEESTDSILPDNDDLEFSDTEESTTVNPPLNNSSSIPLNTRSYTYNHNQNQQILTVHPTAPRGPVTAPRGPSIMPGGPLTFPRAPVAAPRGPVAAPRGPVAAPRAPVVAPRVPVAAPRAPVSIPRGVISAPRTAASAPRGSAIRTPQQFMQLRGTLPSNI